MLYLQVRVASNKSYNILKFVGFSVALPCKNCSFTKVLPNAHILFILLRHRIPSNFKEFFCQSKFIYNVVVGDTYGPTVRIIEVERKDN